MENNHAKVNYGENYFAPVANFHKNSDPDSNSTQSSNYGYPQTDNDAFLAQQAGNQVESNTGKTYTVYEDYHEQQPIQTVIKPKKPHNCGKCGECNKRRKREKEERRQHEQDDCQAACLIQCCIAICQGFFYSTLGR